MIPLQATIAAIEWMLAALPALRTRHLPLNAAAERVVAAPLLAERQLPAGTESLRDGFALATDAAAGSDEPVFFRLRGETAAGAPPTDRQLSPGEAWSVMTGAAVPSGTVRVVPQELCQCDGGVVAVPADALDGGRNFLQRQGSLVRSGELLVAAGVVLDPARLERLATAGVESLSVYRRPRVHFFCTGRELVAPGEGLRPGQKYSSNQLLLAALSRRYGAAPAVDLGLMTDEREGLRQLFCRVGNDAPELLISTGGSGPGRYDLVAETFAEAGGEIFCRRLEMRPGGSLVLGRLGETLFCGLPGPPPAVQTLFAALVGPLLLRLQGVEGFWPRLVEAEVAAPVHFHSRPVLTLRPAILNIAGGRCQARLAGRHEWPDCHLLLPPDTAGFTAGSMVTLLLPTTPFAACPLLP